MTDQREQQWQTWVERACRALDVDPSEVDIRSILDMTRDLAHGVDRPMAPVGAFILGLAIGRTGQDPAGGATTTRPSALREQLLDTIPDQPLGDQKPGS